MATITRGRSFFDGEQLSPGKLNDLVNLATVRDVSISDFADDLLSYHWGSSDPGISPGNIWYDSGSDPGAKFAFVTPSNASITSWLYAMPRREAYYWSESAVSLGTPLFLYRRGFEEAGAGFKVYDGALLPTVWRQEGSSSASGLSPLLVVAMESTSGSGPIKCAWGGLVPAWTQQSQVTLADPLFIDPRDSAEFVSRSLTTSLGATLVSYWRMDEASGTTRADTEGPHHLIDTGGAKVPDAAGRINSSAEFDGTNDRRLKASAVATSGASVFEIAAWVFLNSKVASGAIAATGDKDSASSRSWMLRHVSGADRFQLAVSSDGTNAGETGIRADTFGAPSLDTWYLVTAGHNAVTDEIWISVNGGSRDSASWASVHLPTTGDRNTTIGSNPDGSAAHRLDGRVDEVGLWFRELSADERTELYNGGAGKRPSGPSRPNIFGLTLREFDNTPPGAADFWLWGTGAVNTKL